MKSIVISIIACFLSSTLSAQKEYYLSQGENTIHLTTFGAGDPLLIINGGPGMSSEGFRTLADKLSNNHLAIIYDQRATGESTIPDVNTNTITMDAMIEDIEFIREHFKFDRWIVMGHSFGGMLASYYAANHSQRVKGMILSSSGGINMDAFSSINITGKLSSKQRDSLNYWSNQIAAGDTSYHALYQRGKYLAPAYLYNQAHVPVVAERLTQGNLSLNRLVFQDLYRINFDCSEGLKNIKVPVLIIQGKDDIINLSTAEAAKEVLPHAKIVLLPNCGHYGWLDQPRQYFEAIEKFFELIGT
ncbi:proline iminopeptidase [Marivirga sericea]|uniref:Proline iminopeptidase n=1 Tax=Marivirga sericea TaxID=1028 RepID=A0A1X7LDI4_9BACT|nr:alpha/beta fold hydrolase [Marivirga sericea]SMG51911.1 proline iminopeptidase [Marivirga sericea]